MALRPSPASRRLSALTSGLVAVCLVASPSRAQTADEPAAATVSAPRLRTGDQPAPLRLTASDMRTAQSDLRGSQDLSTQTLVVPDLDPLSAAPDPRMLDDPASLDEAARPPLPKPASADATQDLDILSGPDGEPARPLNAPIGPLGEDGAARQANLRKDAAGPLASKGPRLGFLEPDLALPAGASRTPRVDAITGRLNLPITPLRGLLPIGADDPYAPVGTRIGRFTLTSTLEQSLGVSDNLSRSVEGGRGVYSDTVASARLLSDWSTNALDINALAAYRRNSAGPLETEPRLAIDGRLRLDIDRLTTATLRGAFQYRKEDPIDLDPGQSLSQRPDVFNSSVGANLERRIGRFTTGLDLSVAREKQSALDEVAGVRRLDESFTTYTSALRGSYDLSTAIAPFVEGSIGRRVFDENRTPSGLERNSLIEALRIGLAFDLGEKVIGDLAAGYAWNVPDDAGSDTTASPTIDARLVWSPHRGTDVIFGAATTFDPETDGTGASTRYQGSVSLRHRATARLDLTQTLSATYRDSETVANRETTYAAETGATYWLNRGLALTALARHERFTTEREAGDYTANTIGAGIKLQR